MQNYYEGVLDAINSVESSGQGGEDSEQRLEDLKRYYYKNWGDLQGYKFESHALNWKPSLVKEIEHLGEINGQVISGRAVIETDGKNPTRIIQSINKLQPKYEISQRSWFDILTNKGTTDESFIAFVKSISDRTVQSTIHDLLGTDWSSATPSKFPASGESLIATSQNNKQAIADQLARLKWTKEQMHLLDSKEVVQSYKGRPEQIEDAVTEKVQFFDNAVDDAVKRINTEVLICLDFCQKNEVENEVFLRQTVVILCHRKTRRYPALRGG